jgi:hypothetical protein
LVNFLEMLSSAFLEEDSRIYKSLFSSVKEMYQLTNLENSLFKFLEFMFLKLN